MTMQTTPRHDQILDCLLAGAMGDALGADIEFANLAEICARFPQGFADLPIQQGIQGTFTDDTQMTLFTAEGLVRAAVRSTLKRICYPPGVIHHALLRWLVTQGETPRAKVDDIGLVTDRRLNARRAPGLTCLDALRQARNFGEPAVNSSKGCGSIMRVAPIAFVAEDRVRDLAMECSALTHGHPTGQEAAGAWALILRFLADGADLEQAAATHAHSFGAETRDAILRGLQTPADGRPETTEQLGGGWIAEEALSIAIHACRCARDLEHGLAVAVTHSGDSDSTGAIAGNALGLMFPGQARVHRWAAQLECRDLIERMAEDLSLAMSGQMDDLVTRYPGA
ncbi:ADP-ribosylglycohydrolase family protein [Paracoccus nototheniae]|uniref:ADP-ribosylglycohydrolase family protein n=1 Tax=Paracoccus nototheniae TaxID=2489002 RepID=A0ABW4DUZ0_9RHOB|nr:ADP-ribosylglycohydrolase family protein [Paracoccus nototheniae]